MESLQTEDFCQQTVLHVTCETQTSTILTFGQFVTYRRLATTPKASPTKPPPQGLCCFDSATKKGCYSATFRQKQLMVGFRKDQTPLGNVICSIHLKMMLAALYCRYSQTLCVTTPKVSSASAGATEGRHKMLLLDALGVGTGL